MIKRLLRSMLLPLVLVIGIVAVVAAQGPPGLPHHSAHSASSTKAVKAKLASFWLNSPTCGTKSTVPCYSSGGGASSAGVPKQVCTNAMGYPFGQYSNLGSNGKTLYDEWQFTSSGANIYDIQATFSDGHSSHLWTFPIPSIPPLYELNSPYVYYTSNYTGVGMLTPAGWSLTSVKALLNNKSGTISLTSACKSGTQTSGNNTGYGGNGNNNHCKYPSNPSQIYGSKSYNKSSYYISGWFHQNGCYIPCKPIKIHCHNGYTYSVTTDNNGNWSLPNGLSSSSFPLTLSYDGSSGGGWSPATSYTIS